MKFKVFSSFLLTGVSETFRNDGFGTGLPVKKALAPRGRGTGPAGGELSASLMVELKGPMTEIVLPMPATTVCEEFEAAQHKLVLYLAFPRIRRKKIINPL